jgi:hypothetical protein
MKRRQRNRIAQDMREPNRSERRHGGFTQTRAADFASWKHLAIEELHAKSSARQEQRRDRTGRTGADYNDVGRLKLAAVRSAHVGGPIVSRKRCGQIVRIAIRSANPAALAIRIASSAVNAA